MFRYFENQIDKTLKNPVSIGAGEALNLEDIDFIVKKNLITFYCAIICGIATIYNFINGQNIDTIIYLIGTLLLVTSLFLNNIKYLYFFKFVNIIIINLAILTACIFYNRSEFYVFCFFIIIYVSNILFTYKKIIYIVILTIVSLAFIFIVHFVNGNVTLNDDLENNIVSNFIFLIILFAGITEISAKINYLKDVEYLKDKAKLFKINKSLVKINTEIDQLNVAALHSMKTPLYVAEDFIKQLHNTIIKSPKVDTQEYVTLIKNSIQLSEMYVQKLITYDAIVTNSITYEYFNVLEKIKFVSDIAIKKVNNVSIVIDCNDFMVHTNEFCLLIIIENLITNGLKYNTNEFKKIKISGQKNRYETVIKISDNGVGIDPIYFDRIFHPFVRINQNILIEGTGLGLSSVKIAATKINGYVKVIESSEKGTTFEVKFKNN